MHTATIKPPTHIQRMRNAAERSQHRIVHLLATTDQSYCNLKYHYGIEWLCHYLKGDAAIADRLLRSSIFWGWWKNQWHFRDEAFLQDAEHIYKLSVPLRRKAYKALHNPKVLASELHPNATVMNDGYDMMMQQLLKSKTPTHETH